MALVCFLSGNITQVVFFSGKPTRLHVELVSQAKATTSMIFITQEFSWPVSLVKKTMSNDSTMTLCRQERWHHFGPLLGAPTIRRFNDVTRVIRKNITWLDYTLDNGKNSGEMWSTNIIIIILIRYYFHQWEMHKSKSPNSTDCKRKMDILFLPI
jgi:hypothetical protein